MTARGRNAVTIFVCGGLLAVYAATAWMATWGKCATVDEPGPLIGSWVQIHYHDYRDDCEDPPVWQWLIALGLPRNLFSIDLKSAEWKSLLKNADVQAPLASNALYHTSGLDADTLLRAEHLRMTLVGVVLGAAICWWAWRLGGRIAAVFAVVCFAFDPTVLAHSPLIKNDIPLVLAFVLFMASVWLFGQRATWVRFFCLCLFMSCAIMMKFSGLLTLPILVISLATRSIIPQSWPVGSRTATRFAQRLGFSILVFMGTALFAWGFTWMCYGFRFLPSPNSGDQYDFDAALHSLAMHEAFAHSADPFHMQPGEVENYVRNWKTPRRAQWILFANAHHLFPQSCLIGLLRIDAVSQARLAFLCGKSSVTGWWYYFPLAILFKTPVATLAALAAAAVLMLPKVRTIPGEKIWTVCAAVIFPAVYLAIAMRANVNVGIRHMLVVYSFLFIFLGVAAATAWNMAKGKGRLIVCMLAFGLVAETAHAYPNFIPFFNVFCGGPRGGIHLLGESNIDWGQDLPALATWQAEHRNRPLYLLYWGAGDPKYYGISYVNLPESTAAADLSSPGPGRPCYAISAAVLNNPFVRETEGPLFASILRQQPAAVLNGSIYIYDSP